VTKEDGNEVCGKAKYGSSERCLKKRMIFNDGGKKVEVGDARMGFIDFHSCD
jgi:hypothetical protein